MLQGNPGSCNGRYEGKGWSWRSFSLCCYVGCPGCCWTLQGTWNYSAAHQTKSNWRQQVRARWINKNWGHLFFFAVWSSIIVQRIEFKKARRSSHGIKTKNVHTTLPRGSGGSWAAGGRVPICHSIDLFYFQAPSRKIVVYFVTIEKGWDTRAPLNDAFMFYLFFLLQDQDTRTRSPIRSSSPGSFRNENWSYW